MGHHWPGAGVELALDPSLWTAGIDNGPFSSALGTKGHPALCLPSSHWVPSGREQQWSWRH